MKLKLLPVKAIAPSETNPRKHFNADALAELQASITKHGILQPILVRPQTWTLRPPTAAFGWLIKRNDMDFQEFKKNQEDKARATFEEVSQCKYRLIAGERRWRAAQAAGLKEIPAIERDLDDKAALEWQVVENLQRTDLHPIEEAEGYETLMKKHGYSADELAAKVAKSKAYIYARLKLTALGKEGRAALWDGRINHSVGLLIARIPDASLQAQALKEVTGDRWDGPMPEKEARRHIHENYMLRLKDAPFDTRDADLVKAAGACATCPKRTGNQKELFPDVQSGDVCTDPACFARKKQAAIDRKLAEASKAGQAVVSPEESKKLFYDHGSLRTRAYVDLADTCYETSRPAKWKQTLGKHAPAPILAVDREGTLHELLPADQAKAALKAAGHKTRQETRRDDSYSRARRKAEKRKALLLKAAHLAAGQILPKLAAPLLKSADRQHAKLWALVAQAAYHNTNIDTHAFIAKRRGLVSSQNDARAALRKLLKTTTDAAGLIELTLELLLTSDWNGNWYNATWSGRYKELAKLAQVNLNACEKQAAIKSPKTKPPTKRKK